MILTGHIIVSDDDLEAVISELPNHTRLTREEDGCLMFSVTQDQVNRNRFEVYEEFSDQAAFDRHQQRIKRSRWGEITADVIRHYSISQ